MGLLTPFRKATNEQHTEPLGASSPELAPLRVARRTPARPTHSYSQEAEYAAIRVSIHPFLKRTPIAVAERHANDHLEQIFATVNSFSPITKPFAGDLTIEYGRLIGEGPGIDVIQQRHLQDWEMSEFQLNQLARNNLARMVATMRDPERTDDLIVISNESPFTASLLLVDRLWETLEDFAPSGIVACAPSQNVIVAANAANHAAVARLHVRCAQLFTTSIRRLSNTPIVREDGEWRVYNEAAVGTRTRVA